jgi:hypothetical protein
LKTLLRLVLKDFRRDAKQPWSIFLFASLPVIMTALISLMFGGRFSPRSGAATVPTIVVAVLDQDQDLLGRVLRYLSSRAEVAAKVRLRFVSARAEGLRLVERRQASALVVLPRQLTEGLLNGQTNTIELYENPAEQFRPKVVRRAVSLLAAGLAGVAAALPDAVQAVGDTVRAREYPTDEAAALAAWRALPKGRLFEARLFPPPILFKTVEADQYQLSTTNTPRGGAQP